MRIEERMLRAFLLVELRNAHRTPRWLNDRLIFDALEVTKIQQPARIKKAHRKMLNRVASSCMRCERAALIGCHRCWRDGRRSTPTIQAKIGTLRAARAQSILPNWLSDSGLSRAFGVSRSFVAQCFCDEMLCRNCGSPGRSICLPCMLAEI